MKSSLKRQTNSSTQLQYLKQDQNNQALLGSQTQQALNLKEIGQLGATSFQPIITNKRNQKLRIAQIQSNIIQNKKVTQNVEKQSKQSFKQSETSRQTQVNVQEQPQINQKTGNLNPTESTNKPNMEGQNGGVIYTAKDEVEIGQTKQNLNQLNIDKQNKELRYDIANKENNMIDSNQIIQIKQSPKQNNQQNQNMQLNKQQPYINQMNKENYENYPQNQQKMQEIQENQQELQKQNSIINNNVLRTSTQKLQGENNQVAQLNNSIISFDFKVQNRRRTSERVQQEKNINKSMIADVPEGYQERDLDKEKLDIRNLAKNKQLNVQQNDFEQQKISKEIEDKIYNPQLSNYKRNKQPDYFIITQHTKALKPFPKISTVINFQVINQIEPDLRFYHLFYDLIDQTEKTMQQEYSSSPQFLYYLSVLNDQVKTSFSKIATNRRKSLVSLQHLPLYNYYLKHLFI